MNELINIQNRNGELLVSARDLHKGLGIGKDFTTWVKFIEKYGFEEDIDYKRIWMDTRGHKNGEVEITSVEPPIKEKWAYKSDYLFTIDMAKEVCMIQRNDKGRMFRKYFVECEKKLKEQIPQLTRKQELQLAILNGNELERISSLKEYENLVTQPLLETIDKLEPKAEIYDRFIDKGSSFGFRQLRKELESTLGYTIKEGDLKQVMRDKGWIGNSVKALAYAIRNQYMVTKDVEDKFGRVFSQDRFTNKAREELLEHYKNN